MIRVSSWFSILCFTPRLAPVVVGLVLASPFTAVPLKAAFELNEGDRVAFLGDGFFERGLRYGHIETALTARWPDRDFIFRNIGWAGDGPDGRARAFFDSVEQGFENLLMHVELANPSVVFLCYGSMASYQGPSGVSAFVESMNALIGKLEQRKVRLVILSPTPREPMGEILPDADAQNRNLTLYVDALKELADQRGAVFVDLFRGLETAAEPRSNKGITTNGVHLSDYGYYQAAERIVQSLSRYSTSKSLTVDRDGNVKQAEGIEVVESDKMNTGISVQLRDERLSLSRLSGDYSQNLTLSITNLPKGRFSLEYEGKVIATGSSGQWKSGVQLAWEPSNDQATLLRDAIKKKNELFFHQWRPQNETYLRGFRKHEQGQNAAELEMFEPYIEQEEQLIDRLKRPQTYRLMLKREKGGEG